MNVNPADSGLLLDLTSFSVLSGTSAVKRVSCIRVLPVCCKGATQRLLT